MSSRTALDGTTLIASTNLREGEDERIGEQSSRLCLLKRLQKAGMVGRPPRVECERAVVRQRLVEASHHARECNAPDQSLRESEN